MYSKVVSQSTSSSRRSMQAKKHSHTHISPSCVQAATAKEKENNLDPPLSRFGFLCLFRSLLRQMLGGKMFKRYIHTRNRAPIPAPKSGRSKKAQGRTANKSGRASECPAFCHSGSTRKIVRIFFHSLGGIPTTPYLGRQKPSLSVSHDK